MTLIEASSQQWTTCDLGDVVEIVGGATPPSKDPSCWGGDIPWIAVSDLTGSRDRTIAHGARFLTQKGFDVSSTHMLPAGSVLFSSRAPIGYVAIAANPVCTSQGFKSLVCDHTILDPHYLYWYMRYITPVAERLASGTTFRELSGKAMRTIPLRFPSLAQQRLIAATIEARMAQIGEATARLQGVEPLLDKLLVSSRFAAFEGSSPNVALSEVATIQSGLAKSAAKSTGAGEVPYLSTANVQAGRLHLQTVKTIEATDAQRIKHGLQPGDVLVVEGGDPDKVGRGWLWQGEIENCIHQNHVFAVRVDQARLDPRYLAHFINAPQARRYFLSSAKQTTGIASINKAQLRALSLPLPEPAAQKATADALDRQLAQAVGLPKSLSDSYVAADRAILSLLHAAFAGRLAHSVG